MNEKVVDYKKEFDKVSTYNHQELVSKYKNLLIHSSKLEQETSKGIPEKIKEDEEGNKFIYISLDQLNKIRSSLKTRNDLANLSRKKIEQLTSENDELNKEVFNQKAINQSLYENQEKFIKLSNNLSSLTDEFDDDEKMNSPMGVEELIETTLKGLKEKVSDLSTQLDDSKNKILELLDTNEDLINQLEIAKTRSVLDDDTSNKLNEEKQKLLEEVDLINRSSELYKSEIVNLKNNNQDLVRKLEISMVNLSNLKKEYDATSKINPDNMYAIKELAKILATSDVDQDLVKRIQILLKNESKLKRIIEQTEKQISSLKHHNKDLESSQKYVKYYVDFLKLMLPQIDLFRRSLGGLISSMSKAASDPQSQSWIKGFQLLYQQMEKSIVEAKIEIINPREKDYFNHDIHEPIALGDVEGFVKNQIINVEEYGFKFENYLIKPAKVKVQQ